MADQIQFDPTGAKEVPDRIDFNPTDARPVREVGAGETALRTAGMAAIPAVTTLGMAGSTLATRAPQAIAGAIHPVLGQIVGAAMGKIRDEVNDTIFQGLKDLTGSMEETYAPKPEEHFSPTGEIAGMAASVPMAIAGQGVAPGIQRAKEVVERGGTLPQAAVAGGVTGAVNQALQALPMGSARLAARVGGGVLRQTAAGAATGAAINAATTPVTTAAENVALPAAPGATLVERAGGEGVAEPFREIARPPLDQKALMQNAILGAAMGGIHANTRGAKAERKAAEWATARKQMEPVEVEGEQGYRTPSGAFVTEEEWHAASPKRRALMMEPAERPPEPEHVEVPEPGAERTEVPAGMEAPQTEAITLPEQAAEQQPIEGLGAPEQVKAARYPEQPEAPREPQAEQVELSPEEWRKNFGLTPAEESLAQKTHAAWQIDPEAVEAAARQHEQNPDAYSAALDQIIERPPQAEAEPAAPARTPTPREAELQRLIDASQNEDAKAALKKQLVAETKAATAREKSQAHGAELLRLANETKDAELAANLRAQAKKLGVEHADQTGAGGGEGAPVRTEAGQPSPQPTEGAGEQPASAGARGGVERAGPAEPVQGAERPVQRAESDRTGTARAERAEPVRGAEAQVEAGRGRALSPNELEVRVVPSADASGLRKLGRTVRNMTVGKLNIPDKPIKTLEEAATALAPMRRDAQEQVLALVTDKDGKPLTVIRHTKGGPATSQVFFDSLIPAISRVKGAANVFLAHNHPSGKVEPSPADRMLQSGFEQQLRGSGIVPQGHIVIGSSGKATMFKAGAGGEGFHEDRNVAITPSLRRAAVGISEPQLRGGPSKQPERFLRIESPDSARHAVRRLFAPEEYGVIFTDTHNHPVGVLPMTSAEMGKLRTGDPTSGYGKLMSAAGEVGAQGAIIKGEPGREPVTQNLGRALRQTDITVLDIFHGNESAAERGEPVTRHEPGFESRAAAAEGKTFETPEALEAHLRERFGDKLIDGLQREGILNIEGSGEQHPAVRGRQAGEAATLFHDRLTPETAAGVLMHEVGEHYGMERMLGGERYKLMLDELAKSDSPAVREARAKVEEHYGITEKDGERYWREVAAHLTEDAPGQGFVRRLVNDVRAFLFDKFGTSLGNRVDANLIRGLAAAALRKSAAGKLRERPAGITEPYESKTKTGPGTAAGGPAEKPGVISDETKSEWMTRKFFDRFERVLKGQKLVESRMGAKLPESQDVYLADQLYHGRLQHQGEQLQERYLDPLAKELKAAKKADITVRDADDYLTALHAPERNAVIAARNPAMPDGGSGMTNAEAQKMIASFTPEQRAHLDRIADIIHDMNSAKLDEMVDAGLISKQTRDELRKQYKHYVPLKNLEVEDQQRGIGRGYEMRANDIVAAMGRKSRAGSPIAASIADASRALIRGEKARVDRVMWELAHNPAAKDLFEPYNPDKPPASVMTRKIDKATGQVKEVVDPQAVQDQTLSLVIDGEPQRVYVGDEMLRDQLRKLATTNDPGPVLRAIGKGTGSIGRMLTEFNPAFTIPNGVKDAIAAVIRAPGHEGMSGARVAANIPKSWLEIARNSKDYQEFKALGGKTGAYGVEGVADTMRKLEAAGADLGYSEHAGGVGSKAWHALGQAAHVVSKANEVVEYATRLAAFKEARRAGYSPKEAAAIGKEITVNFNRSGEYGRAMNSVLVFANAALQGLYGTIKYAKSPAVRKAMIGMVALGAASQYINEQVMGENEETGENNANALNDAVADKNLILPFGTGRTGMKIPLSPEYAPLYAIGRRLMRMATQGDYAKEAKGMVGNLLDGTLPIRIGDADSAPLALYKAVTPTLVAPFVDVWTNQDYFGGPIVPEPRDKKSPAPYHTLAKRGTSELATTISRTLNAATGGDTIRPGAAQEFAGPLVAPEAIEHLVSYYAGGLGQTAMQAGKVVGGERDINKMPVLNRFLFDDPKSYVARRYREIGKDLGYALDYWKAGQADKIDPKEMRAIPTYQIAEQQIGEYFKEAKEAAARGDTDQVNQIRDRIREAQSRVIKAYTKGSEQ